MLSKHRATVWFIILLVFVVFFGLLNRAEAPNPDNDFYEDPNHPTTISQGDIVYTTEEGCVNAYGGQCTFVMCAVGYNDDCSGFTKHWAPVNFGSEDVCEVYNDDICTLYGDYWEVGS